MQIKVMCVGGPADGEDFLVSGFQDYFHIVQTPGLLLHDNAHLIDYMPLPMHAYRIEHRTLLAHYKGVE
jgi:hypothetical protein